MFIFIGFVLFVLRIIDNYFTTLHRDIAHQDAA